VLPTVAYEGFGMVTVEALASGTPVVGTPVGATPELLEPLDPRLVARGSDPDSLAVAIRDALTFIDDDFRARCRKYALARFDWDQVTGAWEEALERVVLR
jgi:glycosyltransferase involved in cell wall biosynthesis